MQFLLRIPFTTNIGQFALCFQEPEFFNALIMEIQRIYNTFPVYLFPV